MGLDRPVWQQYVSYVAGVAHGDFGESYLTQRPVSEILGNGFPFTLTLAAWALILAIGIGVTLGVTAAVYQDTWIDRVTMVIALVGVSIPTFVLAPILILFLALKLGWLPVAGWLGPKYVVMPAIVLAGRPSALIARLTRSQMVEVLRQDYIRTAYAKGLTKSQVIFKHALRNALLPVLTIVGTAFGYLLTGSFVVETIFSVPGIGQQSIESIFRRDYPVIQATVLLAVMGFVVVNLCVDLLYGVLDPRVRRGQ
jgi:ABC-type dipeptide/oligopeptide/nickel transport system permease component